MPGGRPSTYKPEYCEVAYKLALLGLKNTEIAQYLEINPDTLYEWQKKHKDFAESLILGRDFADSKVVNSLYKKAIGYSHPEQKVLMSSGKPIIVDITKHYPPDTSAAIFWLKNRQPIRWRDRQVLDSEIDMTVNVDDLKAEIKELLKKTDIDKL